MNQLPINRCVRIGAVVILHFRTWKTGGMAISYPESSGFLVSGATPGRLWGHRKNSIFLIGCSETVSIVLPQKSCGNKIRCPQSLPGVAPLTKMPEDSGYEIGGMASCSFVLASSFRMAMAGFLSSQTQVVYRVKMAILRNYLGARECTILINYHDKLVYCLCS